MLDVNAAYDELISINKQIDWVSKELDKKNISPKHASELRGRLQVENRRLTDFDIKFGIREYL